MENSRLFNRHVIDDKRSTLVEKILLDTLAEEIHSRWGTDGSLMWRDYIAFDRLSNHVPDVVVVAPPDDTIGCKSYNINPSKIELKAMGGDIDLAHEWAEVVIIEDYLRRKTWNPHCRQLLPKMQGMFDMRIQLALQDAKIEGIHSVDVYCISMESYAFQKPIDKMKVSDDAFVLSIKDCIKSKTTGIIGTFDKLSTESIPAFNLPVSAINSDTLRNGLHQPKSPQSYIVNDVDVESIQIAAIVLPIVRDVARILGYNVFSGGYYIIDQDFVLMCKLIDIPNSA